MDGHLPRKMKKTILGKRMSGSALRRRLAAVVIENAVLSDRFCPRCGCESMHSTGNMATYPEVWEKFRCYRCDWLVGEIDNSRFMHCLESGGE